MVNLQPTLSDKLLRLQPLLESDFERLYAVAADPLIWEQHPNPDRYKRDIFEKYFQGAMASGGAFLVIDNANGEVIGSTRFYDWNPEEKSIFIGYTFLSRSCWGKQYNGAMKQLLLDYAFTFAERVVFHVGAGNIRSQKAMEKLGAIKVKELEVAYYGEALRVNFEYELLNPIKKK
jgi:RimJ/RimL family protein N-acetyltransferase